MSAPARVERLIARLLLLGGLLSVSLMLGGLVVYAIQERPEAREIVRVVKNREAGRAVDVPEVPPRYRTTYFAHIWNGGYYAGYYAYLWSEVLDDDAYAWFTEHGGMTRANGQRFRDMILSRGGTGDMGALYRDFRGRDPEVGPLLEERGLQADKK